MVRPSAILSTRSSRPRQRSRRLAKMGMILIISVSAMAQAPTNTPANIPKTPAPRLPKGREMAYTLMRFSQDSPRRHRVLVPENVPGRMGPVGEIRHYPQGDNQGKQTARHRQPTAKAGHAHQQLLPPDHAPPDSFPACCRWASFLSAV